MGQVARELGCPLPSLAQLCAPETGLKYGAKRLKKAMDRKNGDVREALLNYNGGVGHRIPGSRTGQGEKLCLSRTA